jgi:hypothetical protein
MLFLHLLQRLPQLLGLLLHQLQLLLLLLVIGAEVAGSGLQLLPLLLQSL